MKKEIRNCLTWYANKVAETVQYPWEDSFCRNEIKESTKEFLEELKKYINFEELTEEDCKELRFGNWADAQSVAEEIARYKKELDNHKLSLEDYKKEVESVKRTIGLKLIPLYLFNLIPIGMKLICIDGKEVINDGTNLDNDIRYGCVSYGIIPKKQNHDKRRSKTITV